MGGVRNEGAAVTLRRYAPMKPSKGTVIPPLLRIRVLERDRMCVGRLVGFPTTCAGPLELDHVRASHAMGRKSVTCECNLVATCSACHRWKTLNGKKARPLLMDYLARFAYGDHATHADPTDCGHVDPRWDCGSCQSRVLVS